MSLLSIVRTFCEGSRATIVAVIGYWLSFTGPGFAHVHIATAMRRGAIWRAVMDRESILIALSAFDVVLAIVSLVAGAIASVTGFGIGSILTPLVALSVGVKIAVAAVSIPHVIGTAVRFWTLRHRVDVHVLKTFGLMSAAGGLAGALLHTQTSSPALRIVFASILIFAGIMGVTGWSDRLRFGRGGAWVAGGASGLLGGLIGNQGGIRAAAMLAFDVPKEAFVATATAIALIVDGVRMPVYAISEGRALLAIWPLIAIATVFVVAGTLLGRMLLGRVPDRFFRRVVAALILALGVAMLISR